MESRTAATARSESRCAARQASESRGADETEWRVESTGAAARRVESTCAACREVESRGAADWALAVAVRAQARPAARTSPHSSDRMSNHGRVAREPGEREIPDDREDRGVRCKVLEARHDRQRQGR